MGFSRISDPPRVSLPGRFPHWNAAVGRTRMHWLTWCRLPVPTGLGLQVLTHSHGVGQTR